MTPADASLLANAFKLLQQGRAGEAYAIAQNLVARFPNSADVLHMLALTSKATGNDTGAAAAFEAALARAPNDANLLGNYANFLRRKGGLAEAIALYRRALAIAPNHRDHWMNLGLALLDAGDGRGACDALERAVTVNPESSPAWQALGTARRAIGALDDAESALRKAVALNPRNGAAWTNLGVIRRLLGDPTESLACYAQARAAGFAAPEIDDAEASAHLDVGNAAQAFECAKRLTSEYPAYVAGHSMLAHILWENGAALAPGEDPLAAFRAAVAAQPQHRELRLEFVRFLIEAKAAEEALSHIRDMRAAADEPQLVAMEAHVLDLLGDDATANALFANAYPALHRQPGFLNLYVRHLLKTRRPEAAGKYALEALEIDPFSQPALAYLGVIWRLLDDPREHWLCDYERLVAEIAIEPPPGYDDVPAFLQALETTLVPLHTANREPVDQSVRGGSQTSGALFGRRDPVIATLRDAMARAIARFVADLPDDPTHPFLRRKTRRTRFAGSWSVRLWSSGRHVNHFHQQGWISSAFYVSLPPSVLQPRAGSHAGFLQFGEPPDELALGLAPRRVIQPRVGHLALFPSYIWHGTVPFDDAEPRMTVAFDVAPAG